MELKLILEAILFSAQKPLSLKELRDVFAAAVEHAEGDETVRALKKVKESELTAGARRVGQGPRGGPAQLSAGLRGGLVAIRHPAGICALAQGAGRPQAPRLSQPGPGQIGGNRGHLDLCRWSADHRVGKSLFGFCS